MYTKMTTNLMVESVDKSAEFYQETLGFSVVTSVPGEDGTLQFAILSKDGQYLMIQKRTNLIGECPSLATEKVQPSATLYIMVDDFDELYAALKAKCGILHDVHTTFYGAKEFAVADVDGYVLTFTENRDV